MTIISGEEIKKIIDASGYTQADIGRYLLCTPSAISRKMSKGCSSKWFAKLENALKEMKEQGVKHAWGDKCMFTYSLSPDAKEVLIDIIDEAIVYRKEHIDEDLGDMKGTAAGNIARKTILAVYSEIETFNKLLREGE